MRIVSKEEAEKDKGGGKEKEKEEGCWEVRSWR